MTQPPDPYSSESDPGATRRLPQQPSPQQGQQAHPQQGQQAYPQQGQQAYPQQGQQAYPQQGQQAYPQQGYPQGQPGYPQGQPGYPQGQPGHPQGQPDLSQAPTQQYPRPPQGFPLAPAVPVGYGYGQPGGRPVPQGMFYDQESDLVLPQGTQLAGVGRRIGAYFLAIPLIIVTLGIGYLIWGLIVWGNGQTPTLQLLGMRCWLPEDNQIPGFWRMALREVIGVLIESALFVIALVSFALMCTGRQRKTIHDYVAGTVVLHDPNKVLYPR